jgi:hypothetical protein
LLIASQKDVCTLSKTQLIRRWEWNPFIVLLVQLAVLLVSNNLYCGLLRRLR